MKLSLALSVAVLAICVGCDTPRVEPPAMNLSRDGSANFVQEHRDSFNGSVSYSTRPFHIVTKDIREDDFQLALIAADPKQQPLILAFYRGSKWFFLEKFEIKTSTGQIISLIGKNPDRQVVSGDDVKEMVEFYPTKLEFLALAQSNQLTFRVIGQNGQQTNNIDANFIEAARQFVTLMEGSKTPTP